MHGCYAVCGCGTNYRCGAMLGVTYGDMLEAMARITPSQPNDAIARKSPLAEIEPFHSTPKRPGQISERFFRRRFQKVLEVSNRFEKGLGHKKQ